RSPGSTGSGSPAGHTRRRAHSPAATRGDRRPGTLARELRGARSGAGEDHRDVVTAEAEGVVERRYVAGRQIDRGVLCDLHRGLAVVSLDVDRAWGHAVVDS